MDAWRRARRRSIILMLLMDAELRLNQQRVALREQRLIKKRKLWVRPIFMNRMQQGNWNRLIEEMQLWDCETFFNNMRMTPQTFSTLLTKVGPKIERQSTNFRETIPAAARLALTIRYLATGDTITSIALSYRIGRSTAVAIIPTVCEAIWNALEEEMLQPSEEHWLQVSDEFEEKWNFPHCIGALDAKHVVNTFPQHASSDADNHKSQHNIILMALVSASYKFLIVDINTQERDSDVDIFGNSQMGQIFYNSEMNLPEPSPLSEIYSEKMPYCMVADENFDLTEFCLRPYTGRSLREEERIFNHRLSRARQVTENAFGVLASRWRIFGKPMNTSLSTTQKIMKATVCLHNFLMPHDVYCGQDYVDQIIKTGEVIEGGWRQYLDGNGAFQDITVIGVKSYSRYSAHVRDYFMHYFMEDGAVPWHQIM